MSLPEYVFFERVKNFYEELRTGKSLYKVDEVLYFLDAKSIEMTKRWLVDERFQWNIGKGWSMLTQQPPVVAMTLDNEQDHLQFLGNYTGVENEYNLAGEEIAYHETYGRMKMGTINFFLLAPNSDMITTMYLLLQRALAEGETPTAGEPGLRSYEHYGISQLRYMGTDIRPDQNMLPSMMFARTLSVSCSYVTKWAGSKYPEDEGFVSSIDLGNVGII